MPKLKNYFSKQRLARCLVIFVLLCLAATCPGKNGFAAGWNALVVPASLNADHAMKLLLGEAQGLTLVLQADATITSAAPIQTGTLEWNFPKGMRALSQGGYYGVSSLSEWDAGERHFQSFVFSFANSQLDGLPGERISSDWKNHIFFVKPTENPASGNAFVTLSLAQGGLPDTWTWPLVASPLRPASVIPSKIVLGFWDYNYSRAQEASGDIASLFKRIGIGYTQAGNTNQYSQAILAQGILLGGNTHHSYFSLSGYPNYDVAGTADSGGFPCPQDVIALPSGNTIPGVSVLATKAVQESGLATFDYEPTGLQGFCASAIVRFKSESGTTDSEFDAFRAYLNANRLNTYKATDPGIQATYSRWAEFSTQQSAEYIAKLRQALRQESPSTRLLMTPNRSYSSFPTSWLSLGNDSSAMSPWVDTIMPQLYFTGNNLGVKQAIKFTLGWKQAINSLGNQTGLWPLLLVRYTGAGSGNPPDRLKQQIISVIASGATGVVLYYPSNLDAYYWNMLGETSELLAHYEDFYQAGSNAENLFTLSAMPSNNGSQAIYPGYDSPLFNVDWHFTAHRLGTRYLLTLFNLQENAELDFPVSATLSLSTVQVEGAGQPAPMTWRVPAKSIAFVVLESPIQASPTASPAVSPTPAGTQGFQWDDKANFFPNPAVDQGTFIVKSEAAQTVEISLFNIAGRLVLQIREKVVQGVNAIPCDLQKIPAGMYVYIVRTQAETKQGKLYVRKK